MSFSPAPNAWLTALANDKAATLVWAAEATLALFGAIFVFTVRKGMRGLHERIEAVFELECDKHNRVIVSVGHKLYTLEANRSRAGADMGEQIAKTANTWLRAVADWLGTHRRFATVHSRLILARRALLGYALFAAAVVVLDRLGVHSTLFAACVLGWAILFFGFIVTVWIPAWFFLQHGHGSKDG